MKRFALAIVILTTLLFISCSDGHDNKASLNESHASNSSLEPSCQHEGLKAKFFNDHPTIMRIEVRMGCESVDMPIALVKRNWGSRTEIMLYVDVEEVTGYTGYEPDKSYEKILAKGAYDPIDVLLVSLVLSRQEIVDHGFPDAVVIGIDTFPDIWPSIMKYLDNRFAIKEGILGKKEWGLHQYGMNEFAQNSDTIAEICQALITTGYNCNSKSTGIHFPVYENAGMTFKELNKLDDKGVSKSGYIQIGNDE